MASAPVADLDSRFLQEVGTPASGEGRILPLILKDKVAALIYADSGTGAAGLLDAGSLELLVLSASAWLEVNSLRKQAHKEPSAAHGDSHNVDSGLPVAEAPSYQPPSFGLRTSDFGLPPPSFRRIQAPCEPELPRQPQRAIQRLNPRGACSVRERSRNASCQYRS